MISLDHIAFAKGIPSLFVVMTPLQVMCVAEAIHEFCIEDYSIIYLHPKGGRREGQTKSILDRLHLKFKRYDNNVLFKFKCAIQFFLPFVSQKKFSRVFMPCGLGLSTHIESVSFLKKGGFVVYFDDGIASIEEFRNRKKVFCARLVETLCKLKNIKIYSHYFTLYADFPSPNNIYPNHFTHIKETLTHYNTKRKGGIYFVGAFVSSYTATNGVPLKTFIEILGTMMDEVVKSNINEDIYYIPHGKDKCSLVIELCKIHNVKYIRTDLCIEHYFLDNAIYPSIVYGNVSSSLFNIKLLFPDAKIINWYIASKSSRMYESRHTISRYYASHGIEYQFYDVNSFN